ncbi:MAG TPA: redoxin domain-containing protein [Pyrinomonadaceae bacterium]|jgi:thiol-disulfide isomerase/thioredoxin|nr:redoxin domain-containing protein [Pyrinomonadaceae bacterium]
MRLLLTVSLAFVLAPGLFVGEGAAASARPASFANAPAAAAVDGVYRRARRKGAARKARVNRRRAGSTARASAGRFAKGAASPKVTEIDLEGLKKLLRRDADPSKAKPLLVNFWATWCDPCRDEFPDLVRIDAEYRDRGLDFALVSGDDISEIKAGVPKFLRRMKAGMPAYLLNVPDMEPAINEVDAAWGGDLPATFLFDREGKIVYKHFGRIDPQEVRAEIDKALGGK